MYKPFTHADSEKDEATLAQEASNFLARQPVAQFTVELLTTLRELKLPWWTPTQRRTALNETIRMRCLTARPIVRQLITMELTGVLPKAALKMTPDYQAGLIDMSLEEDKTNEDFENAFRPEELALYCDPRDTYTQFMQALPWEDGLKMHRDLIAQLIECLLKDRVTPENKTAKPILSHHDVLSAISRKVWQSRIPIELRVAIDEALLKQEKEKARDPFHAKNILEIVPPATLRRH